jgi:hypothetical protein
MDFVDMPRLFLRHWICSLYMAGDGDTAAISVEVWSQTIYTQLFSCFTCGQRYFMRRYGGQKMSACAHRELGVVVRM